VPGYKSAWGQGQTQRYPKLIVRGGAAATPPPQGLRPLDSVIVYGGADRPAAADTDDTRSAFFFA